MSILDKFEIKQTGHRIPVPNPVQADLSTIDKTLDLTSPRGLQYAYEYTIELKLRATFVANHVQYDSALLNAKKNLLAALYADFRNQLALATQQVMYGQRDQALESLYQLERMTTEV